MGSRDVFRLKSALIDRLRSEVFNLLARGAVRAETSTKTGFNRGPHTRRCQVRTHSVGSFVALEDVSNQRAPPSVCLPCASA